MWPSPEKIPEALCLPTVQVDTVHFSPEATETNGFSRVSFSLNRTAVTRYIYSSRCTSRVRCSTAPSERWDRRADATDTSRRLSGVCAYQTEAHPKEIQGISEGRANAEPLPPALHGKLGRARRCRRGLNDAVHRRLMSMTEHREQRHSIAMIDRVVAPNPSRHVPAIEAEKLVQLEACEIYRSVFRPIIAEGKHRRTLPAHCCSSPFAADSQCSRFRRWRPAV